MKKIINNLRQKPEKVRRHILHISTLVLAVFLFFIWIYTLGNGIGNKEIQAKAKNDLEPLSTLKDNFVNGYKSIQEESSDIIQ